MIKICCYRFFNVFYIRYMAYIYILFFVWTIGLTDIELSDYRIAGLSDYRIIATAPLLTLLASYSMFGLLKGSMSFGGTVFWRMVFEIFGHGLLFWWLQE